MAKLSRSALKGIVKECLVEILNEGILNEAPTRTRQLRESSRATSLGVGESRATSRAHQASRRIGLDSITYGSQEDSAPNEKFEKNVTNAVSNLTKDPVLSSIFQDTARTTLQEQRQGVDSGTSSTPVPHESAILAHGDKAARAAAMSDPMEMFAGSSNNWAALAFQNSTK